MRNTNSGVETSRPELQLGFVLKIEEKELLPGFVRQPKPLLIANYSQLLQRNSPLAAILLCVSSEAAFVMRVGLSMGEEEQPSPSNRLHAALL